MIGQIMGVVFRSDYYAFLKQVTMEVKKFALLARMMHEFIYCEA